MGHDADNRLQDHLFSMAAIELKLLNGAQVGECLMLQQGEAAPRSLATVCLEHGYLGREAVDEVLGYQRQLQRRLKSESSLFGRVAMALRLMSREQVSTALATQRSRGFEVRLGETCVELGYLRPTDVDRILQEQEAVKGRMAAEAPVFGKIAMQLGMLSREQLEECMLQQRDEGSLRRIGEICVDRGFLQPAQVKEVLTQQQNTRRDDREAAGAPPSAPVAASSQDEPRVNVLLRQMISLGASDLHLSADCAAQMRVHGVMKEVGKRPLTDAQLNMLLLEIMPRGPRAEFEKTNDADFAHEVTGLARFRVNFFRDRKGICGVFRQIPYEIQEPHELGLPPQVIDFCWLSKGLVLVTGPTGSGKSTTLASLVDFVNRNRSDHIITIEDPIEFVHPNKKCLINQREVGSHTDSFKNALRAALREDPDIVLVGELRDLETVSIAIETAETGHLVFGTLHTTSAPTTVDRVIEQFPGNQQSQIRAMLSESLRGVIAQMLCKRKGGGRVAAFEILIATAAVANLIREGKTEQLISTMQMGRGLGMQTMNEHFLTLVRNDIVEPGEAYIKTNDKRGLKDQFDKLGIKLPAEMLADPSA